jgi:hypothetical protein
LFSVFGLEVGLVFFFVFCGGGRWGLYRATWCGLFECLITSADGLDDVSTATTDTSNKA